MPGCLHPVPALQKDPGAIPIRYPRYGTPNLQLPCGNCLQCRLNRANEWGLRGAHEAKAWEHNSFLNLTYHPDRLPPNGSLEPSHFDAFIQRLRNRARRFPDDILGNRQQPPRYSACGEYGGTYGRPHYHALAFNTGFPDAKRIGGSDQRPLYSSEILSELWADEHGPLGFANFGNVTPGAAANYIHKYILKNCHRDHIVDRHTGEILKHKEFVRHSTKPPIGAHWLNRYGKTDIVHGYIIQDGHKRRIPRAYKQMLDKLDPELAEELTARFERQALQRGPQDDNTPARRADREVILTQQVQAAERRRTLR